MGKKKKGEVKGNELRREKGKMTREQNKRYMYMCRCSCLALPCLYD